MNWICGGPLWAVHGLLRLVVCTARRGSPRHPSYIAIASLPQVLLTEWSAGVNFPGVSNLPLLTIWYSSDWNGLANCLSKSDNRNAYFAWSENSKAKIGTSMGVLWMQRERSMVIRGWWSWEQIQQIRPRSVMSHFAWSDRDTCLPRPIPNTDDNFQSPPAVNAYSYID